MARLEKKKEEQFALSLEKEGRRIAPQLLLLLAGVQIFEWLDF